jgi:hypothetical protein
MLVEDEAKRWSQVGEIVDLYKEERKKERRLTEAELAT